MEQNYSIDEILSAVDEIHNKKKKNKNKITSTLPATKDYSEVPRHTLKLIEEAEQNIN